MASPKAWKKIAAGCRHPVTLMRRAEGWIQVVQTLRRKPVYFTFGPGLYYTVTNYSDLKVTQARCVTDFSGDEQLAQRAGSEVAEGLRCAAGTWRRTAHPSVCRLE